jgi:peptidoglycan/xylan/chitin deacetylase (PgdA/CDA1 family)
VQTPAALPEEPIALANLLPTATPTTETPTSPAYAPTPDGVARQLNIPILMYHYLSTPPPDANIYRHDLSVPPELFAAHLDRLLAEGYTTVSLYQMIDALQQGTPLPEKPVVITFDDGYRDNYENAFPLLRERAMQATIFVVTDFMDEERPAYLTWEMAREMVQAGISIESHGRYHVSLAGKDDDYLVWQALGSLETIEYELGMRPRFVSYPAGEYDQRTIDIFQSAHYWAGLTTQQGATLDNQQPFELPRVRVRNTTTPDELIRLLSLDW